MSAEREIGSGKIKSDTSQEKLPVFEARYRSLFETANDGILILDAETGMIVDANPFLLDLLGYSLEECVGKHVWDLGFSKNITAREAKFQEVQRQDCVRYEDLPLETLQGKTVHVEFVSNAYQANNTRLIRCNIRDITERNRVEVELRRSRDHYRAVTRSAVDAIVSIDANGKIVDWNPAFERMFGYTEAEIIGQAVTLLIPQRFQQQHQEGMRKRLADGVMPFGGKPVEVIGQRKDGSEFPLEFTVADWDTGQGRFFTGMMRDVTERKRIAEEVRMLSLAVEQSPESIVITDLDANIEYVNDAFVRNTGYGREEVIGKNPRILHSGKTPPENYVALWESLTQGRTWHGELNNKRKDGSEYIEFASITPLKQADGRISQYVAVKDDITERKRTVAKLQESETRLKAAQDYAQVGYWELWRDGKTAIWSEQIYRIFGLPPDFQPGPEKLDEIIHPSDCPAVIQSLQHSLVTGEEHHIEYRIRRLDDGAQRWVECRGKPVIGIDGLPEKLSGFIQDITERKQTDEQLLRLNRTLTMLSECNQALVRATEETELLDAICRHMVEIGAYVGVWVGYAEFDEARTVKPVTLAGMPDEESAASLEHVSWADTETGRGPTGTAIRTGQVVVIHEVQTDPRFGPWRVTAIKFGLQSAASLPLKAGGKVLGAISLYSCVADAFDDHELSLLRELADDLAYGIKALREAAERRRAEQELALGRRALESSNDGIVITDSTLPDRPICYVNPAFERITGYTAAEAVGRNARFLLGEDRDQIGLEELRAALREQREAKVVLRNFRKDGSLFWNELSLAPVRNESGPVRHFISIVNDITERKSYETQLEYQAGHDALTGLANRNLLADRIEQAIAHAKRAQSLFAVLLLDLDRFKLVNDGLGHNAGDALLKIVSQRLAACVRSVDTVARLGGDEFVVVLTEMESEHDAAPLARKLLGQISLPMMVDDREIVANASMGMALYPKDAEDAAGLLKNADLAMYRAKELGRGSMQFYTPELNASTLARLELDTALRRAIEDDELVLYYQPKVELQQGLVVGAEALLRWRHPLFGMVSPSDFIPLAEETGLIVPIGEWVINTACAQIKAWQNEGLPDLTLAVNLSARQFQQQNLAKIVAQALRLNEVKAKYLELEVTESAVMRSPEKTVTTLQELKRIGVSLSLDDFGTGYSSLNYLKRFPIDVLKIDQSFVRDITTDPDDAAIALTIISLAHSLKRHVVAEGVETEAQLNFLRRHHCDEIQGYYFSRPLPAEEFASLLREGRSMSLGLATETDEVRTLLLVDDERSIVAALQRILRRDGYRILTATSAAEGMELLALNDVQVIVSDQRMPVMNGTEFLGRVKEMYPDTIRIVLSGYTELTSVTDAINRGAIYKFLTKPWEDDLLREHIREAFLHFEAKKGKQ